MYVRKSCRVVSGILICCGSLLYLLLATGIVVKPNYTDSEVIQSTVEEPDTVENVVSGGNSTNVTVISDKKIVLIVAYMRSGSTLVGSFLQEYPKSFFVFEPKRNVVEFFKGIKRRNETFGTLKYVHGKSRNFTFADQEDVYKEEMQNWLTCKLDKLSVTSLIDNFHKIYTKQMKTFSLCSKGLFLKQRGLKRDIDQIIVQRNYDVYTCLKKAMSSCQKAQMLVLKFIRLRMKNILSLLPFYPNMKVIHLVRDPRAILNSRLRVQASSAENVHTEAQNICDSIKEDLHYAKEIKQVYPDRLKIVQYEDLATTPIDTARELTDFLGIGLTERMQTFVKAQTNAENDGCLFCTQRRNSSRTALRWRLQLDPAYASSIYDSCKAVSRVFGYLPLTDRTLNDIKIPARAKINVDEELMNDASI